MQLQETYYYYAGLRGVVRNPEMSTKGVGAPNEVGPPPAPGVSPVPIPTSGRLV